MSKAQATHVSIYCLHFSSSSDNLECLAAIAMLWKMLTGEWSARMSARDMAGMSVLHSPCFSATVRNCSSQYWMPSSAVSNALCAICLPSKTTLDRGQCTSMEGSCIQRRTDSQSKIRLACQYSIMGFCSFGRPTKASPKALTCPAPCCFGFLPLHSHLAVGQGEAERGIR